MIISILSAIIYSYLSLVTYRYSYWSANNILRFKNSYLICLINYYSYGSISCIYLNDTHFTTAKCLFCPIYWFSWQRWSVNKLWSATSWCNCGKTIFLNIKLPSRCHSFSWTSKIRIDIIPNIFNAYRSRSTPTKSFKKSSTWICSFTSKTVLISLSQYYWN